MKVEINLKRCNGCGFCMDAYPQYFGLGKRYSYYRGPEWLDENDVAELEKAVMLCPAIAIRLRPVYERQIGEEYGQEEYELYG